MNTRGWVKLWRKLDDHEIMQDHTALAVFINLLLICDKNGDVKTTIANCADFLHLPQQTWYSALGRLKKWQIVRSSIRNRKTLIHICNWTKYQDPIRRLIRNSSETQQSSLINIGNNKEERPSKLTKEEWEKARKKKEEIKSKMSL